jgi:hypothetical protein
MNRTLAIAAVCLAFASAPALADRIVALAPLSTLGAEDTSAATRKLAAQIEQALASVPGTKVLGAAAVSDAIARAKKPQLRACEGDTACVVELGRLVGAQIVVTGEVGGLGDSRVVYLGAVDVTTGKDLRATTLALGANDDPAGAAVRLLDPDRYRGTIHFAIDAKGATVFVNGTKVTPSATGDVVLPVGTQAIRVTHPEYHDFVRFVEVPYGRTVELPVGLQQYPIVEKSVRGLPIGGARVEEAEVPVWRRWYVAGPAAIAASIVAGVVFYVIARDGYPDCKMGVCTCHVVGGGPCTTP